MVRDTITLFTRSLVSLLGAILTTVSAIIFVTLFGIAEFGHRGGPYLGILAFLIVPAIFVVGLLMIPLGIWLQRRRERRRTAAGQAPVKALVIDFNSPRVRSIAVLVVALTTINVIVIATGTYKGVEVMETTEFCGNACHSVMNPELTTYQRSPHARVRCVECHIGPGADWFVKSKLSGSWQVISVAFDLYPRPIPTPIHNLRPARETCEQCHWPTKFVGDRLRVKHHFADDEPNTEKKTVVLLKIGGVENGRAHGIHWHVDPGNVVRYRSDSSRKQIYDIEYTAADGTQKLYKSEKTPEAGAVLEDWRAMDCVDCHNRPTHIYRLPQEEVDLALTDGRLDKAIPFIKREGVRVLQASYPSHEAARDGIKKDLLSFYEKDYADLVKGEPKKFEQAAERLWDMYRTNVFPQMKIEWGTYTNFLVNHEGCFRCHGKEHKSEDGKTISRGCSTCHEVLATGEEEPEILDILYP